jgi:hypothetical protein
MASGGERKQVTARFADDGARAGSAGLRIGARGTRLVTYTAAQPQLYG